MILLIDNQDGCVYNIYQLIGGIEPNINVVRNDKITIDEIEEISPTHIVISGGSIMVGKNIINEDIVRRLGKHIPILGICLGFRIICTTFGGTETRMPEVMQGKVSWIRLDNGCPLFYGLPSEIKGVRYHSTTILEKNIPHLLCVVARAEDGTIMGVQKIDSQIYGLQFHPESFMAEYGAEIMRNFLNI